MIPCLLGPACGRFSDPALESAPLWLAHHIPIFGAENIFVVGNQVDESMFKDVNFIRRDHPDGANIDFYWQAAILYERIIRLRNKYFTLFTLEMDEFLCLEKPLGALLNLSQHTPVYRLEGYDVVHNIFEEPPINLKVPLLPQRNWWVFTTVMSKPAIFNGSLAPSIGGHSIAGVEPENIPIMPGAKLVHMKQMDYDMCRRKIEDRVLNWRWLESQNMGEEAQTADVLKTFDEWFFHGVASAKPIPRNFLSVP